VSVEDDALAYGYCRWCGAARSTRTILVSDGPPHDWEPWMPAPPLEERTELYCPNEAAHSAGARLLQGPPPPG
jgi:hypothetical protein